MLLSALIGVLAAIVVLIPRVLHGAFPDFAWNAPLLLVMVACAAALGRYFWLRARPRARSYDGIADLHVHIHDPANPESSRRWSSRAFFSMAFSLFGGIVGGEGAAAELSKALLVGRSSRAARWSEARRRTDASVALAAGVSAAFGAPMAALLLTAELGLGGRLLHAAVAALSAQFTLRSLELRSPWPVEPLELGGLKLGFDLVSGSDWTGLLASALIGAVVAASLVRLARWGRRSLTEIFSSRRWVTLLASAALLGVAALAWRSGLGSRFKLLEGVLLMKRSPLEAGLLALSQLLLLVGLRAGIGTLGILWPVFALGGFASFALVGGPLAGVVSPSSLFTFAGAAACLGAVLNAPLAAALLVVESSGQVLVLAPCVLAAFLARWACRTVLKTPSIVDADLEDRGLLLWQGRSREVLDKLSVRDAMVSDHETVEEHETVARLHEKLLTSRYPFLPVVDRQSRFVGLLTLDMIEEAWESQGPVSSHSPLAKLLEARDLLYRSRVSVPTVAPSDPLTRVTALFDENPCVPVLGEPRQVLGLLFVHNVRLSYDREMGRAARLAEHFESSWPPAGVERPQPEA